MLMVTSPIITRIRVKKKNLADLKKTVLDNQADLGLAYDGDGDRIGIITHQGDVIMPDRQMIVYAQNVLANNPGGKIIFDVKCTLNLAKAIEASGGVPIMAKTGHSFVKQELKDQQAVLAGEMSGHIFFADRWYGFDDGIFAGGRMLEIISGQEDLNDFWTGVPNTINTPELKVMVNDNEKFDLVDRFVAQAQFNDATKITIDGLRVEFTDGWGLLRASNTTPCLVMRFEADNQAALERIKDNFLQQLELVKPGLEVVA